MKFVTSLKAVLPEPYQTRKVGRVTPCAPLVGNTRSGAHGVTRPTTIRIVLCVISICFAVSQNLFAQTHSTNVVQVTPAFVNTLAEQAFTNNPALKSAAARVEASRANEKTVRTWEDPMVEFGVTAAERMMRAEDGDLSYGIEQPLPLFGKPKAARSVAKAETNIEEANADFQFQQLRKDIAQAAFKMALAHRVLEVAQQDFVWLETMLAVAERRYEFGDATQFDVLRLQNERSKRAEQLKTDEQLLGHEHVNLNRLLNRAPNASWPKLQLPDVAAPIVFSEELIAVALKNEPKLKVFGQQMAQADASAEMARRERYPNFSVGAEARNYSGNGEFREAMVALKFNVPWGNRKKYDAAVQREEAKKQAVELDAEDYKLAARNEIHELIVKIDAARREALLYRDQILPRSEIALQSARAAWENDTGMFRDVLEARRMLLEAQLMSARAISEQYQMLSELVLCCGLGDLEALEMFSAKIENKSSKP